MKITKEKPKKQIDDEEVKMFLHTLESHTLSIKRIAPRQLSWHEIKKKYAHVIQRSKELNRSVNYEL